MRSLILLGGMVLFLPQGGFAQAAPPSAAISAAQAQIAQYPNNSLVYMNLAIAENSANHPDEAIAAASHALAMPYTESTGAVGLDKRPLAYYALTIAYLQKRDIGNALSQADAGLSRYPGSPLLSNAKGMVLILNGQYSRASEVLSPAFASATHTSDPKAFDAWGYVWDGIDFATGQNLVVSQYYAGQYPQALESARQLVALHDLGKVCVNPELPETRKQCTDVANTSFYRIDDHRFEVFLYKEDYALQHLLKGPVGSVAEVYIFSKLRGLKMVRQAVPLTASDAVDFALLALTLNANGDREQALAMAQKAIGLNPNDFWAELSYGLILEDSNRLDEALKALETPITEIPEYSRKRLRQIHLAVLYARKGDMAKAQEIYLAAANYFDPHCVPVAREKDAFLALIQPMVNAHLTKAKQLDAQGKYAESLPEYAHALNFAASEQEASTLRAAMFAASGKMPTPPEMPDDAHRYVVRGEMMLKDGHIDRALVEFSEALRIAPYMPKLYQNTAVIYGELKQYGQAIRQMRLYLTAAPETPDARTAQDQITKWEMRLEMEGKQ
jgi:tetratricopeptide (TPR) repeat protein